MDSVVLQKQVRDNAEDLSSFLKDLGNWEAEMKRKDCELRGTSSELQNLPPVRSKKKKKDDSETKSEEADEEVKQESNKPQIISSSDYSKWDKFDVDEACEAVDRQSKQEEEKRRQTERELVQKLRDEALYEKEKGNRFVKEQKWNKAIECYTNAISADPYDPIFYANRALCYFKMRDYQKTLLDCNTAISHDERYVKAYQRRAAAQGCLGRLEDARKDLKRVLVLEPKNKESSAELKRVELLIQGKKKDREKTDPVKEVTSPIIEVKASTSVSKEDKCLANTGLKNSSKKETVPAEVGVVEPIYKPPHLRSKKPLKTIEIEEVSGDDEDEDTVSSSKNGAQCTKASESIKNEQTEKAAKPSEQQMYRLHEGISAMSLPVRTDSESPPLPPVPKSSVQFYMHWKSLKNNPKLRFQYLKNIPPAEVARIFRDSLESDTFSDIINTLAADFIASGENVFPYLQGLSQVKRFGALTMFMPAADKTVVRKMLHYSMESKTCSSEEASALAEKYEV